MQLAVISHIASIPGVILPLEDFIGALPPKRQTNMPAHTKHPKAAGPTSHKTPRLVIMGSPGDAGQLPAVPVFVDGAHAPGQMHLDLSALSAAHHAASPAGHPNAGLVGYTGETPPTLLQEGRHFAVNLFVHTQHSRKGRSFFSRSTENEPAFP